MKQKSKRPASLADTLILFAKAVCVKLCFVCSREVLPNPGMNENILLWMETERAHALDDATICLC